MSSIYAHLHNAVQNRNIARQGNKTTFLVQRLIAQDQIKSVNVTIKEKWNNSMITERRDVFRMSVCVKNLHLNGIDLDLEVGIISLEAEIEDL